MKASPFIKLVAESYGVPEPTVRVYMRWLREAGLITQGYSGRAAPNMTPLDAARITIALQATERPAYAVEAYKRFAALTVNKTFETPEQFGTIWDLNDYAPNLEEVLQIYFSGQSRLVEMQEIELRREECRVLCTFKGGIAHFDGEEGGIKEGRKTRVALSAYDLIPVVSAFVETGEGQ